jgi:hypothetical protein
MTWFDTLTGFPETSPTYVRDNLTLSGETLTSKVNGRVMRCGRLEIPSLAEVREQVQAVRKSDKLTIREIVANVQTLHADKLNEGSLFQVASQFNLLEMVNPSVTPEEGVGIYERDPTQGPACAVAAGAGTIYRNYFVDVNGSLGQSHNNQIDCLADLGRKFGNTNNRLWQMRNGYALASQSGLIEVTNHLRSLNETERDDLRQALRIGIQWNTEVTLNNCGHNVSQAYCSALPVRYSDHSAHLWEPFARLVLEAAYEATVCAAILNCESTGNKNLFLTMLGGGAFGNETSWITDAIERALMLYQDSAIDVAIVSYGKSKDYVRNLVERLMSDEL